jgi:hypothetical protein
MKNAQPRKQAEPSAPNKRNFSAKSTATEAQYERVLAMLRTGPKNTMELRRASVIIPAARIKEMNDELGYSIPTVDRIAVYALQADPEMVGATC